MRIKHLTALLLSLVLIISLSATVPASAMVEIPQSEPDETLMCSDDLQGFDDTLDIYGVFGVGFFNEREKVEFLEVISSPAPDYDNYAGFFKGNPRSVGYKVWKNLTIEEFKDEVNFLGLNPNYVYEIAYTLDGKSEVELLDKETWIWKIPSDKLTADDVSIYISDNEARDHTVIATLKEFNEGGAYVSQIEERQPNKVVDETKYISASFDQENGTLTVKWDYTNLSKKVDFTVTELRILVPSVKDDSMDIAASVKPLTLKGEWVVNLQTGTYTCGEITNTMLDVPHNREMTVSAGLDKIYDSSYSIELGKFTWVVEGADDYQAYLDMLESMKDDGSAEDEEDIEGTTSPMDISGFAVDGTVGDISEFSDDYDFDYDPLKDDDEGTGGIVDGDGNPVSDEDLEKLVTDLKDELNNLPTPIPDNVVYRQDSEYVQTGIEASGSHTIAILLVIAGILGLAIVGVVVLGKRGKNNVQK